ncbi:MAG: hypothetical protein DYG89_01830 [Caldilinea sp. CFX5]|nr:hypothetical protein [Caldilinea sp. CFX5]
MVVSLYRPQERLAYPLGHRFIYLLLLGLLLGLALLLWPTPAQGQTLLPDADQPCADCHETENAAWQASPHAIQHDPTTGAGGATCTACHGAYVEDHPRTGVMTLAVDSTVCADCHRETFAQWQGTVHAEAKVECTSCHLSHSQTLRLTDEALCVACHKEPVGDRFHLAHWVSQVPCTGCHLTPGATTAVAGSDPALALSVSLATSSVAPSHDFVLVAAQECLDCHRTDVTNVSWLTNDDKAQAQLLDKTQQAATLSTQLQAAKSQVRTLGVLTPVVLGVGISFGGFVGIVFMLWLSRWGSKKEEL